MTKFSIYEFLSYLIPGYIGVKLIEHYLDIFSVKFPYEVVGKIDDSVTILVFAIILGVMLHTFTFKLMKFDWFRKWAYPLESQYVKDSIELRKIVPKVAQLYIKRSQDLFPEEKETITLSENEKLEYPTYLFDYAYYYLEVNDKDNQTKSFQGFYFLFRNLFTLSLINIFLFVITFFLSFTTDDVSLFNIHTLIIVIILLLFIWVFSFIAKFLRGKMIHRVFWSYYIDQKHK